MEMDEKEYRVVKLFKALGNDLRYQLLKALDEDDHYVNELAEQFDKSMPAISRHLRTLRELDLVQFETEGRQARYFLKRTDVVQTLLEVEPLVHREDN